MAAKLYAYDIKLYYTIDSDADRSQLQSSLKYPLGTVEDLTTKYFFYEMQYLCRMLCSSHSAENLPP